MIQEQWLQLLKLKLLLSYNLKIVISRGNKNLVGESLGEFFQMDGNGQIFV